MLINGRTKGSLLNVSIDGLQLSCEVNSDFQYSIEMIPASAPTGGRGRSFVPGYSTWTVNVDGNLLLRSVGADFKTLMQSAQNNQRVFIRFGTMDGVEPKYAIEGWAWVNNMSISAPSNSLAGWNISFQGDGDFTTDWDEFGLIIDANPIEANWPTIYDAN